MFQSRQGLAALLKEGSKQYSGNSEVLLKNIEACRNIVAVTQTSLGPDGMNKLLINHLEKQMVTSDASTILNELEVQHPAAKLLVMAAKMQDNEYGDSTNFLLAFAGDLLSQTEYLVKQGIHVCDIISGFESALDMALAHLKTLVCWNLDNILDPKEIEKAIKTAMRSKCSSYNDILASITAKAILAALPSNPANFDVDNIRVAKLIGKSLGDSYMIKGMIVQRAPSGKVQQKVGCKIIVLACGLEMTGTEAKGTVLFKSAAEMLNFSKGEEDQMEKIIRDIKKMGVEAIIVNGNISDLGQHFCNNADILTLRVTSKFETKRLCRALGASALVRLGTPTHEEIGTCESIGTEEISSKRYTVVKGRNSRIATIVLRGSTPNQLDEVERSIEDATNCFKSVAKSGKFVAGGGASEIELAAHIQNYAKTVSGLGQYATSKFAESFECVPRILAHNAGHDPMQILTTLYAHHAQGKKYEGVGVRDCDTKTVNALEAGVLDHLETKAWAVNLAVDAVLTIIRLDHIIVARPAGGPNPRGPQAPDLDD